MGRLTRPSQPSSFSKIYELREAHISSSGKPKREVRRCPDFRFDWLFKSRTPIELGRRVDLLIRLIVSETKEKEPRGKKAQLDGEDESKPTKKQKGVKAEANGDVE